MNWLNRLIHIKTVKYVSLTLLILFWAFHYYVEKEYFSAILIVASSILLVVIRKKALVTIIVPVLFGLMFYTPIEDALTKISSTTVNAFSNPSTTLYNLFKPNSGREILSWEIQWVNSIIDDRNLTDYQLSPKLFSDLFVHQRIVETAWPVKLETDSKYVFIFTEEIAFYSGCELIDQKMEIAYVDCH